jgi:cell division GTPase FtsZ
VAAAESSAATSSDGGGVAIVGLGARGCAVVDRLVSRGALRRAQFWSLSADPNALQTALSPNRWRLPPGTVDPKDSAVEENAESVARGILGGGVANEPPAVVVVVASASEMVGSPLVTIDAVARLKDGPSQRGWFNVGGSQGITHRGPVFIVAAMTPFAFEGPRKSTDAIEALLAAQKRADAVAVVPQEALTGGVAQNGDPLTVAEVTELADATVQWSAWTILEMFASPAWVGLDGAASESTPGSKSRNRAWRYEPTLSPDVFRNLVAGRPKNAKLGCGACVVGYGTSTLELNFAPDEGQSAAIRVAAAAAAESSPFLRKRVFANAEFACVSVQTQATLTEAAVRAASDALASLVGVDVPQIVTAAKPDPRAPPDQVLVTILVAAQPEDAAARDVSRGGGEGKKTLSLLGMSFPSIPGMSMSLPKSASPSVESVGRAKRLERELREEKAREEAEKARPAQKLTSDMLRKLGLGDPARPVEDGGDETSGAADAAPDAKDEGLVVRCDGRGRGGKHENAHKCKRNASSSAHASETRNEAGSAEHAAAYAGARGRRRGGGAAGGARGGWREAVGDGAQGSIPGRAGGSRGRRKRDSRRDPDHAVCGGIARGRGRGRGSVSGGPAAGRSRFARRRAGRGGAGCFARDGPGARARAGGRRRSLRGGRALAPRDRRLARGCAHPGARGGPHRRGHRVPARVSERRGRLGRLQRL